MSRAERRAYKRLMKNSDPYALPAGSSAARARAQRARSRRPDRRPPSRPDSEWRFLLWAVGGAVLIGLAAFSFAWPRGMPLALYVGIAAAAVWAALVVGFRYAQRRMSARP